MATRAPSTDDILMQYAELFNPISRYGPHSVCVKSQLEEFFDHVFPITNMLLASFSQTSMRLKE